MAGSGLFKEAELAKEKTNSEQIKENETLDSYKTLINEYIANSRDLDSMTVEDLTNLITTIVKKELKTTPNEEKNPIGTIISYMGNTAPNGYLFCNGSVYDISDYKNLANQIKNEFGISNYFGGDGIDTFAVPDLRGEFLRCTGTNSHTYSGSGADVGIHQAPTLSAMCFSDAPNITVSGNITYADWMGVFSSSDVYKYVGAATASFNKNRYASRPTNTSVLYCIKY